MNWKPWRSLHRCGPIRRPRVRPLLESLESRVLPAVNVLTFRNDIADTGQNLNETQLTPANVSVNSFGKLFVAPVDGQLYAQPLVDTGVTIAAGPNTSAGAAGVHDVVFVATEHDSLYALDASSAGSGAVLWKRTFLDASDPNDALPGATSVTPVPAADTGATDISPEVGITSTPVLDASTNTLYLIAKTRETIGDTAHYVQRLHAINIADGTDRLAPYVIGDTTGDNTNNTSIYVYGTGDGSVTDPYNGTGKSVVQFNALHENQRAALSLVNGTVYAAWASHGDNGPYHGWVAAWDVSQLTTSGWQLKGVFNTSPNGGEAGVWQGGGGLAFESNGSAFYMETGNGGGPHVNPTLGADGLPANADYYEALVKVVADPTTSPVNQNPNGWGLKVADYFIPFNTVALDSADQDFGSGAPIVLPDAAGIPGHLHLLLAAGKEGKIYLVDRDNLGKFDPNNDNVLNAVPDGSGHNTPPKLIGGALNAPAWYNGTIYWVSGFSDVAKTFVINSDGTLSATSQTTVNFGYLPGSPVVSANGGSNGIVWVMDRNANQLHAYDAKTFATELWNSGQNASGADNLGTAVKFATPVVANGEVFVGTADSLVVYGLKPPANAVPSAPTLAAKALSSSSINLTWTDPTVAPNTATGYLIEQSTDGTTFTQVTTAPAGSTALAIGGLSPLTTYYFRIRGFNSLGDSPYSNIASDTTNISSTTQAPDAPTGLGATPASANSVALRWTNNAANETGFHLDRATDSNFTQNLITQTLPAAVSSYTDTATGLAPGGTFYYRLRAFNDAGDSANSNVAAVSIPLAPPRPSNALVTNVTANEIDLSWTDNDGRSADGYKIFRALNGGTFTLVATLPALNATPPSTYRWSDTGLSPGTFYEYHIEAFNVSGNNDFTGANATTLCLPPGGLTASADSTGINLAWTASTGAVRYNVYRGTTSGAEVLYHTGVTGTTFRDASVAAGTTYFYTVTAVNANGGQVPPLPSESAASNEASAALVAASAPASKPSAPVDPVDPLQAFWQLELDVGIFLLDSMIGLIETSAGITDAALAAQTAALQNAIQANPLQGTTLGEFAQLLGYQLALHALSKK